MVTAAFFVPADIAIYTTPNKAVPPTAMPAMAPTPRLVDAMLLSASAVTFVPDDEEDDEISTSPVLLLLLSSPPLLLLLSTSSSPVEDCDADEDDEDSSVSSPVPIPDMPESSPPPVLDDDDDEDEDEEEEEEEEELETTVVGVEHAVPVHPGRHAHLPLTTTAPFAQVTRTHVVLTTYSRVEFSGGFLKNHGWHWHARPPAPINMNPCPLHMLWHTPSVCDDVGWYATVEGHVQNGWPASRKHLDPHRSMQHGVE